MIRSYMLALAMLLMSSTGLFAQGKFEVRGGFSGSVRIPIEVYNNLILMQVKINGSFPLYFIVDTGVKTTLLTEPIIMNFVMMDEVKPIKVRGLGAGELIDAQLATGIRMELPNGIIGKNMRMIVLPEGAASYSAMFGRPVVGILGSDLFKDYIVEVNYYREYIRLIKRDAFKLPKKYEPLPIELRSLKPYVKAKLFTSENDTLTTHWLLDTGSSQAISVYNPSISPPQKSLHAFIGQGLSGSMYGKIGRVSAFDLGIFSFDNVIAGFPDTTSLRWVRTKQDNYSNIGSGVLSRFSIIFDYQGKMVYLRKNPKFREQFEYNTSGIEVMAYGPQFEQYFISYVRPESPAEEAGIQIGDKLLSVNGYEVTDLNIGEVTARLNRRAGRKLCLRVERKETKIKECFILESSI